VALAEKFGMRRSLSVASGLLLGVALSQFPEYAQQYTQRLGGAVDELRAQVTQFDQDAAAFGLNRQEALARYQGVDDGYLSSPGQRMEALIARYEDLNATLLRIQGASPIERFNMLPQFFDTEIGGRTLDNFKPAIPVTGEGFIYAAVGVLGGYLFFSMILAFVTLPFRRRRVVVR
jgi:hypothetical protein